MFGTVVWASGNSDLRQAECLVVRMALHALPAILGLVGDEFGLGEGCRAKRPSVCHSSNARHVVDCRLRRHRSLESIITRTQRSILALIDCVLPIWHA